MSNKTTSIKNITNHNYNSKKLNSYLRILTPFSSIQTNSFNPPNSEFDIVCMVVNVGERPHIPGRMIFILESLKNTFSFLSSGGQKRFQQVHVSNEEGVLLLLNFWNDVKELALSDVIRKGAVVLVKNLQWRSFDKNGTIQAGYVADYTSFFKKGVQVETFTKEIAALDMQIFLKECLQRIKVNIILY